MAKFCTGCGAPVEEGLKFCTGCGTALEAAAPVMAEPVPQYTPPAPEPVPQYTAPVQEPAPQYMPPTPAAAPVYREAPPRQSGRAAKAPGVNSPYQPISTWGFVGILVLFSIPIVGLVFAIVWACGGCRKINKRNLSRAMLILMAIGLVLVLLMGLLLRGIVRTAMEETGLASSVFETAPEEEADDLSGALGALGLLSGMGEEEEDPDLGELALAMEALEGLSGGESAGSLEELMENVEDINARAEAVNDGWPESLPPYPYGEGTAVASYRTEFTGTTPEEMKEYVDTLKDAGFKFQDFYDFGISEEDMLSGNGWWGTDGKIYVSMSCYDGTLTMDHTTELPDLEGLFG